ncbi:MAG: helix-turn-helix domain-containing protein [Thermodesulfobacteriota bacterium]
MSIYTLRSWIYQKPLPCVRLGRRVLLRREDLENLIKKNLIEAKS